jgi:hypothetical protein
MNQDFEENVKQEIARIEQLDLAEQPSAFGRLRETLEQALNQADTAAVQAQRESGGN